MKYQKHKLQHKLTLELQLIQCNNEKNYKRNVDDVDKR